MLGDFNSWWRTLLEGRVIDSADSFYVQSVTNCYKALCHNQEQSGILNCSLNIDDVGQVIIAYIGIFTKPENAGLKYYYDEYSDRYDPYRSQLITTISSSIGYTDNFVNSVLSYLYWGIKRSVVPKAILRPRGIDRFKSSDWYIKEPFKSLFSIRQQTIDFLKSSVSLVSKAIETGLDAISKTTTTAYWFLSNLPYIMVGGAVLLVGGQLYYRHQSGKFYGEDLLKSKLLI